MSAKKITIPIRALLELDPADFGWVDALDAEELKGSIYELLETVVPIKLSYWRETIQGTISVVHPSPQQLKAALVASTREV